MFRVPYRWLPRTVLPNIRHMWGDLRDGVWNVFRWLPVVWFDADYDWEFLAVIMEKKFERMAEALGNGVSMNREQYRRQLRICRFLVRRLREDEYFTNAEKRIGDGAIAAKFANKQRRADQQYLGTLIGKHLTKWWD